MTNNEIANNTLNFAANQIRQERKNVFVIIGCLTAIILFLLYLDSTEWHLDALLFTVGSVIFPLVAVFSFPVLFGYALHRKHKGRSYRQALSVAFVSFVVVALVFGTFLLVGALGLGPVPR